jgi:hypothetical protein
LSSKLFFAVLTGGALAALAALLAYYLQHREQIPSGPCISVVENGDFIDDVFKPYRFNGTFTFWPQAQAITVFGTAASEGEQLRLRRQIKLQLLSRNNNRMVLQVRSLHVDPSDQVRRHDVFFSEEGEKLFISVKKLNANEYMYFVNDSWIFMCRLR